MSFPIVGSLRMNKWDQATAIHSSSHLTAALFNWDSSDIRLLSGYDKSNPGPRHRDKKSVYCIICSAKIKSGIQQ